MKSLAIRVGLILFCVTGCAFAQKNPLDGPKAIEAKKKLAVGLMQKDGLLRDLLTGNANAPFSALQATIRGTFWRTPEMAKLLDLSDDQQKKMDDIFYQHRLKLVDLTASLQKEELVLEPLFVDTRLTTDEARIITQIDRIAEARAELEKANSRMLLHILQVLTPDQWGKLPITGKRSIKILSKPAK